MKKIYFLTTMLFMSLFLNYTEAAPRLNANDDTESTIQSTVETAKDSWKDMTRKEKRSYRKALKKDIKSAIKDWKKSGADTSTLLLVIIAILLPPLAMLLYDGFGSRFLLSLLLTLLFYLPGLIYTLIVILGNK